MVISRGEIDWGNLSKPVGSIPAGRRPVLVIQADRLNHSPLNTVVIVTLTSNLKLGQIPTNVYLRAKLTGLERDSIVNVSQIATLNKSSLDEFICDLSDTQMEQVEEGLKMVLGFNT